MMEEKILTGKKHGMAVLLLTLLALLLAVGAVIWGCIRIDNNVDVISVLLLSVGGVVLLIGWLPLCGLRVLKPQEALVLTLFGKYIGTLKGEGFYFVNPFCTAINPAAKTKNGNK